MLSSSMTLFLNVETKPAKEIVLSEAVLPLIEITKLNKIKDSLQETSGIIRTSSSLPGHENKAEAVESSRQIIDQNVLEKLKSSNIKITENILLRLLCNAIKAQQAGNCYEFSLYCYYLLTKNDIHCEIFRIKNGNHVFLVMNRDTSTPVNDYRNWNKEAIVIDPFFNSIYMAHEIPNRLQSCSYDSESNKISYIPFNPDLHILSNDVLQDLVADWTHVMSVKEILAENIAKINIQ